MEATEKEKIPQLMARIGAAAKAAARALALAPTEAKNKALTEAAQSLRRRKNEILSANAKDMAAGEDKGLSAPMLDRLSLTDERLEGMATGLDKIAKLDDPIGTVLEDRERPNGLRIQRVRVPLGVIGVIYESRPNVTADAAALCLKAGNASILRGGKEAINSNRAIAAALRAGLESTDVPADVIQLIPVADRAAVDVLLEQDEYIDLVIPRGGEGLIRAVTEKSRIPVLQHYKGVCHIYVDASADAQMATDIVSNAKVQRPGVCNALETLLVHQSAAPDLLPGIANALTESGVELRGCARTRELLGEVVVPASEADWDAEYLDLILAVRIVDDLAAAIEHIDNYGSSHTEAIVTSDDASAQAFVSAVQSSTVLVNASTRFADGGQLGLGAEIGISTSKLHAFGPMGARELTTRKFVVKGTGQVRS